MPAAAWMVRQKDGRNESSCECLTAAIDKTAANVVIQRVVFTYDVFDRRLSKAVDTTPLDAVDAAFTHFVYDGQDILMDFFDTDGAGPTAPTVAQRYLQGPAMDQVLAQDNGAGNVLWHLSDHLGTIRDLVDNTGTVVNHLTYDSYGNVIAETNSAVDSRYLFTGREFDAETGLMYYRARYYDPRTGKFLSSDPIGFAGGQANLYAYVMNDPIANRDPSGHGLWKEIGKDAIKLLKEKGPDGLKKYADMINDDTEKKLQGNVDRVQKELDRLLNERNERNKKQCPTAEQARIDDNNLSFAAKKLAEAKGELNSFEAVKRLVEYATANPLEKLWMGLEDAVKYGEHLDRQY